MQPKNSQEALSQYQSFTSSRRKPQDILLEAQNRAGLPNATQRAQGLRAAITNTENLIRAVEPSVAGRTGGSLVSDAQRTRMVGLERQPLQDSFREESRALEGETANISELERRALQESQLAISDDDSRAESMKSLYDILYGREQAELDRAEKAKAAQREADYLRSLMTKDTGSSNKETAAKPGLDSILGPQQFKYGVLQDPNKRKDFLKTNTGKLDIDKSYKGTGVSGFLAKLFG